MEAVGTWQKDKLGRRYKLYKLTDTDTTRIHEALVKFVHTAEQPDESGVKQMDFLAKKFHESWDEEA